MEGAKEPSIEQFYAFCAEGKLMGVKCEGCGALYSLPKRVCSKCGSKKLSWFPLRGTGKLVSYTMIHVAPPAFQGEAPYALGMVELDEGVRLLSRIKEVKFEELKVGMRVAVGFEKNGGEGWPRWPKYYFKPVR